MKTHLLAGVSLFAVAAVAPTVASAQNFNDVNQNGYNNQAGIIQLGSQNTNWSGQNGNANFDWTLQAAHNGVNSKASTQSGDYNSIVAIQIAGDGGSNGIIAAQQGYGNSADVWQVAYGAGATNGVDSVQTGVGQSLSALQYATSGSSNTLINRQTDVAGSGSPPNRETAQAVQLAIGGGTNHLTNQQSGQHDVSITSQFAYGGTNVGTITQGQFSDSSFAQLAQVATSGGNNLGTISQNGPAGQGDGNSASLLQVATTGGTNVGHITQYGNTNEATTVQFASYGGYNYSNTVQVGTYNEAKVYQNTDAGAHAYAVHELERRIAGEAYKIAYVPNAPYVDLSGLSVQVWGQISIPTIAPVHTTHITVPGTFQLNKR